MVRHLLHRNVLKESEFKMADPYQKREFESWHRALSENKLNPKQLAVLQEMVDAGQVKNLAEAANLLDWRESVIDPDEHMYGF